MVVDSCCLPIYICLKKHISANVCLLSIIFCMTLADSTMHSHNKVSKCFFKKLESTVKLVLVDILVKQPSAFSNHYSVTPKVYCNSKLTCIEEQPYLKGHFTLFPDLLPKKDLTIFCFFFHVRVEFNSSHVINTIITSRKRDIIFCSRPVQQYFTVQQVILKVFLDVITSSNQYFAIY